MKWPIRSECSIAYFKLYVGVNVNYCLCALVIGHFWLVVISQARLYFVFFFFLTLHCCLINWHIPISRCKFNITINISSFPFHESRKVHLKHLNSFNAKTKTFAMHANIYSKHAKCPPQIADARYTSLGITRRQK